jgi:hypothetical protein
MKTYRALLLVFVLMLAGSALAQPPLVYSAAERAVQAVKPDLGKPGSFSFERLTPTSQSNLGCALVAGVEMGRSVTPYRITVSFGQANYIVHVSADGSLTQLCDSKFENLAASTPAPPSGCEISSGAQPAVRLAPDDTTAVMGGTVLTEGKAYAIGRTANTDWLQFRTVEGNPGWVLVADVAITNAAPCASLPVTAIPDPDYDAGGCFITPAAELSNVRERPTTQDVVVAQIYEGSYWQVLATNPSFEWYYVNPGWVAKSVTQQYGFCDDLLQSDNLIGVGNAFLPGSEQPNAQLTITPGGPVVSTNIPSDAQCPPDFNGFLVPRIFPGAATARVDTGGSPNRVRAQPNVNGELLYTAQPGRTFDRVLVGPACSGTVVWWLVEIDSVVGWTAESDSATRAYFIEPVAGVPVPTATAGISTAPSAPTPSGGAAGSPSTSPARLMVYRSDGTRLAVVRQDTPFIEIWDITPANITNTQDITFAENVIGVIDLTVTGNELAALTSDGILHIYDFTTLAETRTIPGLPIISRNIRFNPDGTLFVTTGCNTDECAGGVVHLWQSTGDSPLRLQPAHPGVPGGAVFNADGSRIASWGNDGIQVWDTLSGAFVTGIATTNQGLYSNVLFLPDGSLVQGVCTALETGTDVVRCAQADILVIDGTTGQLKQTLNSGQPGILTLIPNADGSLFATISIDDTVHFWDSATLQEAAEPFAMPGTLAFNPQDPASFAYVSEDGNILLGTVAAPTSAG